MEEGGGARRQEQRVPSRALFVFHPADHFGSTIRRQEVLAGHDFPAGRGFKFQAGAFRNLTASLRGNLAGGEFREGGKDEFGLVHVVAEILGFETLQVLVRLDADAAPFLVDDIGQDGIFIFLFDVMSRPVVGELVTSLLPGHALLNPLVAATMFLPGGAGAFEAEGGVGHFLHPFVADFGEPQLDRLGLGAGDALDETQRVSALATSVK